MGVCVTREDDPNKAPNSARPEDLLTRRGTAIIRSFGKNPRGPDGDRMRAAIVNVVDTINDMESHHGGVTLLDIQRGIFLLLQGAAYRVFRIAYAANYHTHEREHSYPFLFSNYVKFVGIMMQMYKDIHVVDQSHYGKMDGLVQCLATMEAQVRKQVESWTNADEEVFKKKESELKERRKQHEASRGKVKTPSTKNPAVSTPSSWPPTTSKMPDKTSHEAAFVEGFGNYASTVDSLIYLEHSERVLLDMNEDWQANEMRRGAVIPVSFWYEEYMPKLLEVCSVGIKGYSEAENDEIALDDWLKEELNSKRIGKYCTDVTAGWDGCSTSVKLSIKRAWRLMQFYFLGPEKQRERSSESAVDHRETGELCQYVAFIDIYLQKSYVEQAGMRLTFPYLIGPCTWYWHHVHGERAAEFQKLGDTGASQNIVDNFKKYLAVFVTMYPCPYCRHHLNEYVIQTKERELYPVEYLFVGWTPSAKKMSGFTTAEEKIAYITNPRTLRLFVWKLHNAVNSSISRGESWYHPAHCVVTSRYWPNLYGALDRGARFSGCVSAEHLQLMLKISEAALVLNTLRDHILTLREEDIDEMQKMANQKIDTLDEIMISSGILTNVYGFKPDAREEQLKQPAGTSSYSYARQENFTLQS